MRRNNGCLRKDIENITLANSVEFSYEITWQYDYKGELINRYEERYEGVGFNILPSDYLEDVGILFAKGDFVTIKKPSLILQQAHPSSIYVAASAPGRRIDSQNPFQWENLYYVYFLGKGDEYDREYYDNVHESQIEHFQGELPADSFLYVLSAFFKYESSFSKEAVEKLYCSKKIYAGDLSCHYKFIVGLQPRQAKTYR